MRIHNKNFNHNIEDITPSVRKRTLTFYGHLKRMDHLTSTWKIHKTNLHIDHLALIDYTG